FRCYRSSEKDDRVLTAEIHRDDSPEFERQRLCAVARSNARAHAESFPCNDGLLPARPFRVRVSMRVFAFVTSVRDLIGIELLLRRSRYCRGRAQESPAPERVIPARRDKESKLPPYLRRKHKPVCRK